MAIYNNREVTVMGPTHTQSTPETVRVQYTDGSQETVSMGRVQFTEEEKKQFVKLYPSRFDSVNTVSDEDIKAVRLGVTPPSSPELKAQAEDTVRRQKQAEETQKNMDKAKADADKRVNAEVNKPSNTPVNTKAE